MKRVDLAVIAAALLGAALVLYATSNWGPAVYQLGLHNVTAAQGWIDGRGMCTTRGEPFTQWPPLLAAILATGKLAGVDYGDTARFTDALALAATVVGAWAVLERLFGSRVVALIGASALIVLPKVFEHSTNLASEPLFVAFVVWALWFTLVELDRPRAATFAALVACSALACLQRYVGVVLVGCVGVSLCWPVRGVWPWRRALVYVVLAAAPLALWIGRNMALVGKTTGERIEPDQTLGENLRDAGSVLTSWWLEPTTDGRLIAFAGALLALLALASLLRPAVSADARREWRALALYAAFPLAYLVFIVVTASLVWLDPLDGRLLYPALPFAFGLAILGADALIRGAARWGAAARWAVTLVVGGGLALVLANAAAETARTAATAHTDGAGGFGTRVSVGSELVQWLRAHPLQGDPYSNFPEVVAFATHRPAKLIPTAGAAKAVSAVPLAESPFTLVWVDRPGGALPETLTNGKHRTFQMEIVADLEGATICRVTLDPHARELKDE